MSSGRSSDIAPSGSLADFTAINWRIPVGNVHESQVVVIKEESAPAPAAADGLFTRLGNMAMSFFATVSHSDITSSHQVEKANFTRNNAATKKDKPTPIWYVKYFKPSDALLCVLEAVWASFYKLLTPEFTARTHACYKQPGQYTCLISKSLPKFVPQTEDPLKHEETFVFALNTDDPKRKFTLHELVKLDKEYLFEHNIDPFDNDAPDVITVEDGRVISMQDMRHFRTLKGIGSSITSRYIFQDDDAHGGNVSKRGYQIDFGMSFWPLMILLEVNNLIKKLERYLLRKPTGYTFAVTDEVVTDMPYVDPKNGASYSPTSHPSLLQKTPYTEEQVNIYREICKTNPVAKYYARQTMLKFILLDKKIMLALVDSNLNEENNPDITTSNLNQFIVNHIYERMCKFRGVMINNKAIRGFLDEYGDLALFIILEEIKTHNRKILKRAESEPQNAEEYHKLIVSPEVIEDRYTQVFKHAHKDREEVFKSSATGSFSFVKK